VQSNEMPLFQVKAKWKVNFKAASCINVYSMYLLNISANLTVQWPWFWHLYPKDAVATD